ncbi:MAG: hypothetical protein RLZZ66_1344 [Pseudomonadota bacterium]|jgi:hypothetical protein
MTLLIRLPIILFLTLLQFAAPLIHAHTQHNDCFESSIHLPEFEQVNSLRSKSPSISNTILQSGNMVVVSIGIKNELTKPEFTPENSLGALFFILIIINRRIFISCFDNQPNTVASKRLFTIFAPRAPPLVV